MIGAAAQAALIPCVVKIKGKRRVNANRGLEALRRLPRSVSNSGNAFAVRASWMQRHTMTVNGYGKALANQTARFDLEPFERTIDITSGPARSRFFAKNVPGLERGAELYFNGAR